MSEPSRRIRPTEKAPDLDLPLAGGGRFVLSGRNPERYTMLVFNRGLHCPVCRAQLSELNRSLDDLGERGVEVASISGENQERAERMREEWGIDNVPLAYGLAEEEMRDWGLFVSEAISDEEPPIFNEPAVFIVAPDQTVYYEAILSMPVGRPHLDELLEGIEFWAANDYPARGAA